MQKMYTIVKTEGQASLVSGVFRESFRSLSVLMDTAYLKVKDKDHTKADLIAIMDGVKAVDVPEDISAGVRQKVQSLLLSRCGFDLA